MNKTDWENLLSVGFALLAIYAIREFFRNDNTELVSDRGAQVLNDPILKKKVDDELARHKAEGITGPVIMNFDN